MLKLMSHAIRPALFTGMFGWTIAAGAIEIDPSFGIGGTIGVGSVATAIPQWVDRGLQVLGLEDGALVTWKEIDIGENIAQATIRFELRKLNSQGQLATDFRLDPEVENLLADPRHPMNSTLIAAKGPGGKVLIATPAGGHAQLVQLLPNGMIDREFGHLGWVTLNSVPTAIKYSATRRAIYVQSDSSVIRLRQYGTHDLRFGQDGVVMLDQYEPPMGCTRDQIPSATIDEASSTIFLFSTVRCGLVDRFMILAHDANGKLDPGFGTGGRLEFFPKFANWPRQGFGMRSVINDGEHILVHAYVTLPGSSIPNTSVLAINRQGQPLDSFGTAGEVTLPMTGGMMPALIFDAQLPHFFLVERLNLVTGRILQYQRGSGRLLQVVSASDAHQLMVVQDSGLLYGASHRLSTDEIVITRWKSL